MAKRKPRPAEGSTHAGDYEFLLRDVVTMLESARHASARAVNAVMTATYWQIGRRIVEREQGGQERAAYRTELIERLSKDLSCRFGRGYSQRNREQMRQFHLCWPIPQTLSAEFNHSVLGCVARPPTVKSSTRKAQTMSADSQVIFPRASEESPPLSAKSQINIPPESDSRTTITARFPLPWSHYVKLLSVKDENARQFYESEALRGGWSVRQLGRQISSQFYQRTLLSKNKAAMLRRGAESQVSDHVTPEEEIRHPFVLEFLDLKDEYSGRLCRSRSNQSASSETRTGRIGGVRVNREAGQRAGNRLSQDEQSMDVTGIRPNPAESFGKGFCRPTRNDGGP